MPPNMSSESSDFLPMGFIPANGSASGSPCFELWAPLPTTPRTAAPPRPLAASDPSSPAITPSSGDARTTLSTTHSPALASFAFTTTPMSVMLASFLPTRTILPLTRAAAAPRDGMTSSWITDEMRSTFMDKSTYSSTSCRLSDVGVSGHGLSRSFSSARCPRATAALSSGADRCAWNSAKLRRSMSSTFKSSTRSRFKIMLYVRRNWLSSLVADPVSMRFRSTSGSTESQHAMTTVPTVSRPRRPARPAICVYSPGRRFRKSFPSDEETVDRAIERERA